MESSVKVEDRYQKEKVVALEKVEKSLSTTVYLSTKRTFDIFCGVIGVIALIPLSIVIKFISIISGDFNSIFYVQKRIGKDGKEFNLYKFRSMVTNADEILKELVKDEKLRRVWEENQKLENEPRITRIGKFLRKTSLDEIPQFFNVLKGDMSLIGPRPLVEGELDAHGGNHQIYEAARPGLSSWWACNGRSETTYEERLNLEYYYVENASVWLDIKAIFKTVASVVRKDGAK